MATTLYMCVGNEQIVDECEIIKWLQLGDAMRWRQLALYMCV